MAEQNGKNWPDNDHDNLIGNSMWNFVKSFYGDWSKTILQLSRSYNAKPHSSNANMYQAFGEVKNVLGPFFLLLSHIFTGSDFAMFVC